MSQDQVGAHIGKSQSWVADVLKGRYKDIKWADGQSLISLYDEITRVVI